MAEQAKSMTERVGHQLLVVHYGRADPTLKFLASYLSTSPPEGNPYPGVIVVDNGPEFSLQRLVKDSRVLVITKRQNLGFGKAFNYAAETAQAFVLVGSNADVDLSFGLARKLAEAAAETGGLAAPILIDREGQAHNKRAFPSAIDLLLARTPLRNRVIYPKNPTDPFWVTGACFAVTAEAHGRIGGFDDRFFLYFEDVDYCRRLLVAHVPVDVLDGLRTRHRHERSSRSFMSRAERFHLQSALQYFKRYPRDVWRGYRYDHD